MKKRHKTGNLWIFVNENSIINQINVANFPLDLPKES